MRKIKIGLAGIGTVGSGLARILKTNKELIIQKSGLELELVSILDLNFKGKEDIIPKDCLTTSDLNEFFNSGMDVMVELIGGKDFAKTLIERAIAEGKHVVTANKALLAVHGKEIFEKLQKGNSMLKFEAAVAGAIPIINTIENCLAQNKIHKVDAILNGTSNYILSRMRDEKIPYQEVLAEAQEKGFAESDPSFDVDGIDAAHKIAILANLCFGTYIPFDDIYIQGIGNLELMDMDMAERMGYVIKPLGITKLNDGLVEARVHPTMVPKSHILANIPLENNGIYYQTDYSGPGFLFGKGAGSLPTGSAVISDIIRIGQAAKNDTTFSTQVKYPVAGLDKIRSKFYLRLMTKDQPGVLAKISGILGNHKISIASVVQLETGSDFVPLTMMTHEALAADMQRALVEIKKLDIVSGEIILLHVEE